MFLTTIDYMIMAIGTISIIAWIILYVKGNKYDAVCNEYCAGVSRILDA